jgi:hypothetical protein
LHTAKNKETFTNLDKLILPNKASAATLKLLRRQLKMGATILTFSWKITPNVGLDTKNSAGSTSGPKGSYYPWTYSRSQIGNNN